jgi:hypothetical protein
LPKCGGAQGNQYERAIEVQGRAGWSSVLLTLETPPKVDMVGIRPDTGGQYIFDVRGVQGTTHPAGDAQVTNSGKTYKITGHISPASGEVGSWTTLGPPVPFEFDATCP